LTKHILHIIFLITTFSSVSQQYDGNKGFSAYEEQNSSLISTKLRGKHSASIGLLSSFNSPFYEDMPKQFGFHIGYNYIILGEKTRYIEKREKTKTRDLYNHIFGLQADILTDNEYLITAKYFKPFLGYRGLIFDVRFFSEYGLGIHHLPTYLAQEKMTKFNFSLEFIRLQFLKSSFFIHAGTNYDLSNNFLNVERKNIQFNAGFKYYIFKIDKE